MAVDVLRGLHFLHTKRIVHLDLKSPNILLTRHGQAKLADVGLSKAIRGQTYLSQISVIGECLGLANEGLGLRDLVLLRTIRGQAYLNPISVISECLRLMN